MQNIFDIWEFVNFVTDKYRNGYISPEEFSKAIDEGQNIVWGTYFGKRQEGNELALVALQPFYKKVSVTSSGSGLATYPTLWAETQAIYTDLNGVTTEITQVLHNELQQVLASSIYPIAENPRYLEQETGVQLYPKATTIVDWHYLSKPTTPVLGYTVSGNTVIYDPLTSVQLQFATQYWYEVISIALNYIGVNLSNNEVSGLMSMYGINANNGNGGN